MRRLAGGVLALAGMLAVLLGPVAVPAGASTLNTGDVLTGSGNGLIGHFTSSGTFIENLNTSTGSSFETGMCFDNSSNLRTTNFSTSNVSLFNSSGALVNGPSVYDLPCFETRVNNGQIEVRAAHSS